MKRGTLRSVSIGLALLVFTAAGSVGAESIDDLKLQLEQAKNLIQNLETRIQALEQQQRTGGTTPLAGTGRTAGSVTEKTGSVSLYGFAQLDTIQDFNRVDPDWNATLRPSRIPTSEGVYGEDGETIFSVRQTRLGLKAQHPTDWGDFGVKLEVDFFGVGSDAGQTTIRPRHFYGELGPILAGQTHSLFMDINAFPNTIDYWGPTGIVFLRHPQLRWTPISGSTSLAFALEEPGNDVSWGIYPTPYESGGLQSKNDLPDLTARLFHSADWGHIQVAGILRRVGFETVGNPGSNPADDALGWGINLSTNIKFRQTNRLILTTVYGQAIANYMNDGGNDLVVVDGQAETLPLLAMAAYYDHYWNDSWSSSIGYSFNRIDNNDAQVPDSYKLGQYGSVNLLWYPWVNTMIGAEYLYGQREDKDGSIGEDHRVQLSFKYSFDKTFGFDM